MRGARYAARFGLVPDPETERQLRETTLADDLRRPPAHRDGADRRRARLPRGARPAASSGGCSTSRASASPSPSKVAELLAAPPWSAVLSRERAICCALDGAGEKAEQLAGRQPGDAVGGVELARGAAPEDLALARASGAAWLDDYIRDWRSVVLEIGGRDLLEAGVEAGPRVGEALGETLRRKLDGQVSGRDEELRTALELARGS